MNAQLIKHLVLKDWYFNRNHLMLYTFIGVVAVALLGVGNEAAFYVGVVLIISDIVVIGAHLIFVTVIYERKEQTLPLIMSLPISFMEYTVAKVAVNMGAYLSIWLLMVVSTLAIITSYDAIPNGLIPFATIALLELVVAYVLVLSVAIITESEAWTIVVMGITNVGVSLFWFFLSSIGEIKQFMEGSSAIWNSTAVLFVLCEVGVILLLLLLTFYFQSKKTEFL